MPIIRIIVGAAVVCAAAAPCDAMDQAEANRIVAEQMTVVRGNEFAPAATDAVLAIDGPTLLEALKPFQNDPEFRIRRACYWIAWVKGRKSDDVAIRQKVVELLLASCRDAEMAAHMAQRLLDFREADFSEASKATLRELMQDPDPRAEMLLAAGIAGLRDIEPRLRLLAAREPKTTSVGDTPFRCPGAATRALARMGDREAIAECVRAVEECPDKLPHVVVLLEGLSYIRQPEAVAVLVKYLDSDESWPWHDRRLRKAAYAIRYLSQIVKGLPVEDKPFQPDADIETARRWMKEHKDYTIIR